MPDLAQLAETSRRTFYDRRHRARANLLVAVQGGLAAGLAWWVAADVFGHFQPFFAPVTAILNLVFRPQTPEKKRGDDLGAVGDQIDLLIEEAQKRDEQADATDARPPQSPAAKNDGRPSPAQTR